MARRWAALLGAAILANALNGCLATTHHFNTGKTLAPGNTEYTYGLSMLNYAVCDVPSDDQKVENGFHLCESKTDGSVDQALVSGAAVSSGWRLGVREKWGPFTGVDLGYLLEIPHTAEFDGRLGLPGFRDSNWHHSVSAGWGLGLWPDNTWFVEYAISRTFQDLTVYGNFRESLLATQFADLSLDDMSEDNKDDVFSHSRRFLHQANIGLRLNSDNHYIFPDYWHINFHVGYPVLMLDGSTPTSSSGIGNFDHSIIFALGWHFHD